MFQSRTHTCGELRLSDAGKNVTISGWLENIREVGANFAFLVLRDFYGTTQVVVETEEMMQIIKGIHKSYPINDSLSGKPMLFIHAVIIRNVKRYYLIAYLVNKLDRISSAEKVVGIKHTSKALVCREKILYILYASSKTGSGKIFNENSRAVLIAEITKDNKALLGIFHMLGSVLLGNRLTAGVNDHIFYTSKSCGTVYHYLVILDGSLSYVCIGT